MTKVKTSANAKKIVIMFLVTFGVLLIWRLGSLVTMPFFDYDLIKTSAQAGKKINFGFLDIFSGGALGNFSILCLGITPYITSTIVTDLLELDIVPRFKELMEEGEEGRQKLNQYTKYIALGLAFVQSLTLIIGVHMNYADAYFTTSNFFYNHLAFCFIFMSLVATAGTAFCIWLAELITGHGVGNGTSLLIVAGILATFPEMIANLIDKFIRNTETKNILIFIVVILVLIAIIILIAFMEEAQRKIPVQYANRPAGASFRGRSDSNIPIKLNSASVLPIIFAATLMSIPTTLVRVTTKGNPSKFGYWVLQIFSTTSVSDTGNVTINAIGLSLYVVLIVIFSFFYSFLQLSPDKMADNLQKQNAYIPGVRPGEETVGYFSRILFKVTVLGATYLSFVAVLPVLMTVIFNLPASTEIGGTGLIIVVGVAIETWRQLKQMRQEKQYRGFIE